MDKDVGVKAKPTLQKIIDSREERSDDFSLNQKMRARFHQKKHEMKREENMKITKGKYSLEVMFVEENGETVESKQHPQISRFYMNENKTKDYAKSKITYKPMFKKNKNNPWHDKFEFVCIGNNVLMILKKNSQ